MCLDGYLFDSDGGSVGGSTVSDCDYMDRDGKTITDAYIQPKIKLSDIKYLKSKYQRLHNDIEEARRMTPLDEHYYSNLLHTHSKLGIILEELFGYVIWRGLK